MTRYAMRKDANRKRIKQPIYALAFSGTNGYVNAGSNSSLNLTETFSFCAAIIPQIMNLPYDIISQRSGDTAVGIIVGQASTFRPGISVYTDSSHYDTAGAGYPLNRYHKVVITYDTNVGGIIYIDGANVKTLNVTGNNTLNAITYIGNYKSTTYYRGLMFDVRIYNDVLTPTEVLAYPNLPIDSNCKLWHDYTSGSAEDRSGNGNNGTLSGEATFIVDYYE